MNPATDFDKVQKFFHWTVGTLILCLLAVGFIMVRLPASSFRFDQLYTLHKSIGLVVLAFVIMRLYWRCTHAVPPSVYPKFSTLYLLERASVPVLYFLMVAMPLSGWIMTDAGGHPVHFFHLYAIPSIFPQIKELSAFARQAHSTIAYALIGALTLHITAAFYHHFFLRDRVLIRMLPGKRPLNRP